MNNCKILLIDSPTYITLLNESISHLSLPLNIQCFSSVADAVKVLKTNKIDLIIVSDHILLLEGIKTINAEGIPTVILCDSYGMERFIKDLTDNVSFIIRPFDLGGIPDMISKAIEFMLTVKEKY